MINARHSLLRIALKLAESNLHSMALLIVSPSDQGKTDTLRLFSQNNDGVWVVPAASTSRLTEYFRQRRNILMIALDEPYDWISTDYKNAAMMCKHILEGTIKAPRSTVFSTSVDLNKQSCTAVILTCNDIQYDTVRRNIAGCGLLERAITVMIQNSNPDTLDYIDEFYRANRFEDIQFKNGFSFCMREIGAGEKKYIDRHFAGYARRTVQWIARTTPAGTFNDLKPYLVSGLNNDFIEEEIQFEV